MVVKRAAGAALVSNFGIADNGRPSNEIFVVDLDELIDGHSSAEATLSKGRIEARDGNALK